MKKTVTVLLIAAMLIGITPSYAAEDITVMYDGTKIEFDQAPQIINDRTMVPMRAVFETLGAQVSWDEATRTVTGTKDKMQLTLTVGSAAAVVNGKAVLLDSPAVIVGGRTLVPIRFISESLNCTVNWEEETKSVLISSEAPVDERVAAALKKLDTKFSKTQLDWLISMYDTESGGFYYSASARDTESFGPDLESVVQNISTLQRMGMLYRGADGKWNMPEWFREKTVKFFQDRQDPDDGYFYDPQYKTVANQAKKERNTSFSASCLRGDLDSKPLYLTPAERVAQSKSEEAAKPTADGASASAEDRYSTPEKFRAWLEDIYKNSHDSYFWGSDLASATEMIKAYGRTEQLIEWLKEKQNPETGMWEDTPSAEGINGVLKISGFFNKNTEPYPNVEAFVRNCVEISKSYTPRHASEAWNPLGALKLVLASYGDELPFEIKELVDGSIADVISNIANKMDIFLMPDGGYGYTENGSSVYSNDVVVSLGVKEGDANAMSLMSLIYNDAYLVAGVPKSNAWVQYADEFWERLKNAQPVVKVPFNPVVFGENFDTTEAGKCPEEFIVGGENCSAEVEVVSAKTKNKALRISVEKGVVNLKIKHPVVTKAPMSLKLKLRIEADSKIQFWNTFGYNNFEWLICNNNGQTFDINHRAYESGLGATMAKGLETDTWYTLQIIYEPAEKAEDVLISYYIDDELCGTAKSYYASDRYTPPKSITETKINSFSGSTGTVYIDDVQILAGAKKPDAN